MEEVKQETEEADPLSKMLDNAFAERDIAVKGDLVEKEIRCIAPSGRATSFGSTQCQHGNASPCNQS